MGSKEEANRRRARRNVPPRRYEDRAVNQQYYPPHYADPRANEEDNPEVTPMRMIMLVSFKSIGAEVI